MEDQADEITRIRTILMNNPKGSTIEEIAKKLPLNRTSTAKYLNTLLISGQAEMRTFGRAKVFTLSQRVPFSQMLNLSSDLLLVLDQNLVINQVNEPFIRVFGLSRESLIGLPVTRSPVMRYISEQNMSLIQEAVRGTEQSKIDRFEINDQGYFFRIKLIPLVFDQGGQGLAIILEDITELKKYQQHLEQLVEQRTFELKDANEQLVKEIQERQKSRLALEQSEKKYRELVEYANSIIIRVNESGVITFFNEFAVNFFGFSEREILGKNIIGILIPLPDEPGKNVSDMLRTFLKPADSTTFNEIECIRKNGDKVWVAWTTKAMYDAKGNPEEFLVVGMDITQRRHGEYALQQINTKLNLVSSIARHDILNKLTVIYGIISLLQEKIPDPTYREYLKKAEEAAVAIKKQIEFTRDYKNMGLEKADWQNVIDTLQQSIKNVDLKGVTLDLFSRDLEIFADPWLKKVFFNLIDNTLRYAEHVTKITVSYRESEDGLDILFEDNGIGIPFDEKEKIFERGYGKNIGYGLFMAREILAITQLSIKETGEPGKGARYEIHVPKRLYSIK
ncbi:MAG: PAS domain S-box protein [Methanoregula sp.]|nr:PAS domain S-box protein [Methanoregula sp.]